MRIATHSSALTCFATAAALSLGLGITGCIAATNTSNVAPGDSTEAVSAACEVTEALVGTYTWRPDGSGAFGDYEVLTLDANGAYSAKVDAILIDPNIHCVAFPCTLPESGTWCATADSMGLQIRPESGSLRTSTATLDDDVLELVRADKTTVLFKETPISACAAVTCLVGSICVEVNGEPSCVPAGSSP